MFNAYGAPEPNYKIPMPEHHREQPDSTAFIWCGECGEKISYKNFKTSAIYESLIFCNRKCLSKYLLFEHRGSITYLDQCAGNRVDELWEKIHQSVANQRTSPTKRKVLK